MLEVIVVIAMLLCTGLGYCGERLTENIFSFQQRKEK